jgi:hypothetical protein
MRPLSLLFVRLLYIPSFSLLPLHRSLSLDPPVPGQLSEFLCALFASAKLVMACALII